MKIEIKIAVLPITGQYWKTVKTIITDEIVDYKLSEFLTSDLAEYKGKDMRIYINGKKYMSFKILNSVQENEFGSDCNLRIKF